MGEEVALGVGDPVVGRQGEGFLVLDPLGDRLEPETLRERHHGLDHVLARSIQLQITDEFDVDLQLVDLQLLR